MQGGKNHRSIRRANLFSDLNACRWGPDFESSWLSPMRLCLRSYPSTPLWYFSDCSILFLFSKLNITAPSISWHNGLATALHATTLFCIVIFQFCQNLKHTVANNEQIHYYLLFREQKKVIMCLLANIVFFMNPKWCALWASLNILLIPLPLLMWSTKLFSQWAGFPMFF